MKALCLALASGLACTAPVHAQLSVLFSTNSRISGSSDGSGVRNSNGLPLQLTGGGQASFFLAETGGGGQTGGGLLDGATVVAETFMEANASITSTLPGGWQRSRLTMHGETDILIPGLYTANMNSSLTVNFGTGAAVLDITTPQPVFHFVESSGTLSNITSLTFNGLPVTSGTNIAAGSYVFCEGGSGFVFASNQPPSNITHAEDDGMLTAYFRAPYCASAQSWSRRSQTGPTARYLSGTAYDRARSRIVLFGGGTSSPLTRTNELWEWDGISWTQRQANDPGGVGRPSPRQGAALAYDSVAQRFYLFGGQTDAAFSKELWRLDPVSGAWTNLSAGVPAGLSARWAMGMVFDRERSVMVIYGGSGSGADPTDTWEFDPAGAGTWTLKPSAANPGSRVSAGMVFDSLRGHTVLFGGGASAGLPPTDTPWIWNGTEWKSLGTNAGPSPRFGPGLAFDEVRGRIVLLGGATLPILNDTWELNGATWTQLATPPGLAARASHSMVYDAAHQHILAFGGLNAALAYEGDSWAFSWPQISQQPASLLVSVGQTATFTVGTSAAATGFQWRKNGAPIGGATAATFQINNSQVSHQGNYSVVVTFPCGAQTSADAVLTVTACYANCDGSTASPLLTANDFGCFIDAYAGNLPYANCDGSTGIPALTANDFGCFVNRFAAGCS